MAGRGLNKVQLIGNLGNEPDQRRAQSGALVVNLSVATTEAWRSAETQQLTEKTEWHRVVLFGKQAEVAAEYLHKGSKVYVEGKLQTRKWQDQRTGIDRYTTEIIGRELIFLDRRQMNEGQGATSYARTQSDYGSASANTRADRAQGSSAPADQFADDPIDDIPW